MLKKMTLHSVYISKDTGECLFERKLIDNFDFDRDIFTSLFVAVTKLMKNTLHKQIIDMRLEGMTLYTKAFKDIRVIIVVMEQDSQTATTMNQIIDQIGRNFVNQFQKQLDYVLFGASMYQAFDSTLQQILRDGWVQNSDCKDHQPF